MMVAYFKGLPKNEDWLRVDVTRHFEGIPRHSIKDFVGVKRPVHNQKTIDFVQRASHTTNLHSHSENVGKLYDGVVKPMIHTIPDDPRPVIGAPQADGFKSLASTAGSLGLGGLISMVGFPEFAPIAASIGAGLGTMAFDYAAGTDTGQKMIMY